MFEMLFRLAEHFLWVWGWKTNKLKKKKVAFINMRVLWNTHFLNFSNRNPSSCWERVRNFWFEPSALWRKYSQSFIFCSYFPPPIFLGKFCRITWSHFYWTNRKGGCMTFCGNFKHAFFFFSAQKSFHHCEAEKRIYALFQDSRRSLFRKQVCF